MSLRLLYVFHLYSQVPSENSQPESGFRVYPKNVLIMLVFVDMIHLVTLGCKVLHVEAWLRGMDLDGWLDYLYSETP
jgi:hypothetical protein